MARGHQAQQAKEKNAKEAAKKAKSGSQLTAQKVGLKISCKLCLAPMTNYKCLVQHYEAKHPKENARPRKKYSTSILPSASLHCTDDVAPFVALLYLYDRDECCSEGVEEQEHLHSAANYSDPKCFDSASSSLQHACAYNKDVFIGAESREKANAPSTTTKKNCNM